MDRTDQIEEQMEIYREHHAAMKAAIERGDGVGEIKHYHIALQALLEARKLAGIGR